MRRFFLIVSFITLLTPVFATPSKPVDKVIAFVNDDIITSSELRHQVDLTKKQLLMENQPLPDDEALEKQVLNQLIDLNLQLQVANKMHITIDQAQLKAAIERIAKRNHITQSALKQQIESSGMPFATYRKELQKQMLIAEVQQQLVGSKIVITPDQVKDFVHMQKRELAKNTEYHLQHLLVPLPDSPSTATIQATKKRADELVARLRKGEDFDRLVANESAAHDALRSGDLGWRKLSEVPEAFAKVSQQLATHAISQPIQTSNGFHIIKLQGKRQQKQTHMGTQYHVRQIFMKADDLTSNQEIKRKLTDIRNHLQRGESFAEYAKNVSQEQQSASAGGDMGWVFTDEVPPQIAQIIENAQLRSIAKPIRSNAGWHLIQVLGKKQVEDSERMLELNAKQMLYQQKMQIATQNWLQTIRSQAYVKINRA